MARHSSGAGALGGMNGNPAMNRNPQFDLRDFLDEVAEAGELKTVRES